MGLQDDLNSEVKAIFATKWSTREGTVVPEAESIKLGNNAVTFEDAVVLYADMAGSTQLVNGFQDWFAAEVYKAFLHCASKIIRDQGGSITAFDGDRIMGVFIGDSKNTNAARCALKINYAVLHIINPAMAHFQTKYTLRHAVGIDRSKMFIARTGIRGSNDLVWVGRSANYAAKLCAIRDPGFSSFITTDVYDRLREDLKLSRDQKQSMWQQHYWAETQTWIYKSSWHWSMP